MAEKITTSRWYNFRARIGRRRFLQLAAGVLAWWLIGPQAAGQAGHHVGVGRSSDPYMATRQAVEVCGEWPAAAIADQKVIVKPNLVVPMTEVTLIRTLHDWVDRPAGGETLIWDGRDDEGHIVPPGRYTARVQARYSDEGTVAYATGWVWVVGHRVHLPILSKAGE